MLKKIRRRFILAAMAAFGAVMLVIIVGINVANYYGPIFQDGRKFMKNFKFLLTYFILTSGLQLVNIILQKVILIIAIII